MKKLIKKVTTTVLIAAMAMGIGMPAFAEEKIITSPEDVFNAKEVSFCEQVFNNLETSIPEEAKVEYYKDILELQSKGFTVNEMVTLDTDIRQVANLIEDLDMDTAEIENLKNGFLTSRPTDPEILIANSHPLSYEEVGLVAQKRKPQILQELLLLLKSNLVYLQIQH